MSNRVAVIILCVAVVLVAVLVLAGFQRAKATQDRLKDLYSGDPSRVVDAVRDLRKRGHAVERRLIARADAPAVDVRLAVAELLGDPRVGHAETAGPVLLDLLNDEDLGVRRKAAGAIGRLGLGTQEAVDALLTRVKDLDEDLNVRIVCVRSLGALSRTKAVTGPAEGGGLVVPALLSIVEERPPVPPEKPEEDATKAKKAEKVPDNEKLEPDDADVTAQLRVETVLTLGRISTPEAALAVIRSMDDKVEVAAGVREAACIALGDLNQAQTILANGKLAAAAAEGILGALDDKDPNVRIQAAAVLSRIPTFMARDTDAQTAERLGQLEKRINTKIAALGQELTERKGDPSYWVRRACRQAAKMRGVRIEQPEA